MCTGAELLLAAGATATAATAYNAYDQKKELREEGKRARAEADAAKDKATQNAYAKNVMARRALRENSLFTGSGSSSSGGGRQTLGV